MKPVKLAALFVFWTGAALGWIILGLEVQQDWEQVGPVLLGLLDGF